MKAIGVGVAVFALLVVLAPSRAQAQSAANSGQINQLLSATANERAAK